MVVEIDGREWFDDVKLLRPVNEDGDRETLRFLYEYQDLDGLNSGGPGGACPLCSSLPCARTPCSCWR